MKNFIKLYFLILMMLTGYSCQQKDDSKSGYLKISRESLKDKIKGAWALQTIGVTYGGPTEFRYKKMVIPDSVNLEWTDTMMYHWMTKIPGLFDDIYMDLTFVDIFQKEGLDAPASSFANAFANAGYSLWHANQQGRSNILNGIMPPASGNWLNNPHADDIDFQIESDFAGIMNPGMAYSAIKVCDKIGHIMNSGDGYYGGVFISSLYSYAFQSNNIGEIVNKALAVIPKESSYYQCIYDVINWHNIYPTDWKTTWIELEKKWGEDIGCPDGAADSFNIDSKMNSAYVVIGLLYGGGDLGKTMEIAMRCGQDSDCNPSSAAGVLGPIIGYRGIPQQWSAGLAQIENMDFKYTTISLNDVYAISYKHALEMIARNGGDTTGNELKIKLQDPVPVPLEVNFPGYKLAAKIKVGKKIEPKSKKPFEIDFEGVGFVLRGVPRNVDFLNKGDLLSPEETKNGLVLEIKCTIDTQPPVIVKLPLDYLKRNAEIICYRYELPLAKHKIRIEPVNFDLKVYLDVWDMLVYTK